MMMKSPPPVFPRSGQTPRPAPNLTASPSLWQRLLGASASTNNNARRSAGGTSVSREAQQRFKTVLMITLLVLFAGWWGLNQHPWFKPAPPIFSQAGLSRSEAQALYVQALVAETTGDTDQALELLHQVEKPFSGLDPFLTFHFASIFEKTGCESCLQLRVKRLLEHPHVPAVKAEAFMLLGKSHLRAREPDKAIAVFEELLASSPTTTLHHEGAYFLGQAYYNLAQQQAAATPTSEKSLRSQPSRKKEGTLKLPKETVKAWLRYLEANAQRDAQTPPFQQATVVAQNLLKYQAAKHWPPTQLGWLMVALVQGGDTLQALELAKQPYRGWQAHLAHTQALIDTRQSSKALELFLKQAPRVAFRSKESNQVAQALLALLPTPEAKQQWLKRLQGNPDVDTLRLWLQTLSSTQPTVEAYEAMATQNRSSRFAPFALATATRLALANQTYPKVIELATAFESQETAAAKVESTEGASVWKTTPYRPAVLFWKAVALKQQNRRLEAEEAFKQLLAAYPFSYYALRASSHLTDSTGDSSFKPYWQLGMKVSLPLLPTLLEKNSTWLNQLMQALPANERLAELQVQQLQEFLTMHTLADAQQLIELYTPPASAARQLLMAYLNSQTEQPFMAIKALRDWQTSLDTATARELSPQVQQLLNELAFPVIYGGDVQANSRSQQVSPYVVLGLIRQESSFNPQALSSANAVGLMQLLPSTANDMAKRLTTANVTATQLRNPSTNIRYGTAYLAWLYQQLQQDPLLVVASYNAGLGNVSKWVNQRPELYKQCPDCFVESIPFDETRHYIQHVFEGVQVYRQRYGS